MADPEKLRVFSAFKYFLIILKALNFENFERKGRNRVVQNVCLACGVTLFVALMPITFMLGLWYIYDYNCKIKIIVIVIPPILTVLQLFLTFITLRANNRVISETIERIQELIDQRSKESQQSFEVYEQVDRRYTVLSSFLTKIFTFMVASAYFASAMFPVSYAIFDFPPPQVWVQPVRVHSLLNSDKYLGFATDWIIGVTAVISTATTIVMAGSLYSGLCLYINGMVNDMRAKMVDLAHQGSRWAICVQEIEFHNQIISLAKSISHIMETILFTMALACTIAIALNLVAVEINGFFSLETMVAFIDLITVLLLTVIYSNLSEWVTTDLLEIGDIFYNSEWYRLAVKEQRLLALPIQRAQREFRLSGLGLFDCSLAVFSSIVRTAGSYFVILRSFK